MVVAVMVMLCGRVGCGRNGRTPFEIFPDGVKIAAVLMKATNLFTGANYSTRTANKHSPFVLRNSYEWTSYTTRRAS